MWFKKIQKQYLCPYFKKNDNKRKSGMMFVLLNYGRFIFIDTDFKGEIYIFLSQYKFEYKPLRMTRSHLFTPYHHPPLQVLLLLLSNVENSMLLSYLMASPRIQSNTKYKFVNVPYKK